LPDRATKTFPSKCLFPDRATGDLLGFLKDTNHGHTGSFRLYKDYCNLILNM